MTVLKYLDVSLDHISSETLKSLMHGESCVIAEYSGGFILSVPDEIEFDAPTDLRDILEYAKSECCTLARLDFDASHITSLKYYE